METILLGRRREMTTLRREDWERELAGVPESMEERLSFMTEDHRRVRYFVVSELPRQAVPLAPDRIAHELDLPLERVGAVLGDLERNLFFLTRNEQGAVAWAYPLTVERTPHHLSFRSGERLWAAWAEDAVAAPFVQGHLWQRKVEVEVATACAHCGAVIHLELDSEGSFEVREPGAEPLVFHPDVDWSTFSKSTIIHDY